MNFESLKNLDSSFRQVRKIALWSIAGSVMCTCAACYTVCRFSSLMGRRVYILDRAQTFCATRTDLTAQDRMTEARNHVRRFHELFFTLSPDPRAIRSGVEKALYLADSSARELYGTLCEKGYYSSLVAASAFQYVEIDSMRVVSSSVPYEVTVHARQTIVRKSQVTHRTLRTSCLLRPAQRTENNPHGFYIEKFRITDNSDLSTERR